MSVNTSHCLACLIRIITGLSQSSSSLVLLACFTFSLGSLLAIDAVLDDGVEVLVSPGQKEDIVCSDGGATGMLTEALKVDGDIFYMR